MAVPFRSFIDSFSWAFLMVFFIPTTLVVASWKAAPGDIFFPVKIAVEDIALLVVSPSSQTSGSLRIKYTERRFAEAQNLLATKQSVTGLMYLEKQVEATKQAIAQTSDPHIRQQLAREYVFSLADISSALVQEKTAVVAQSKVSGQSQTTKIDQAGQATSVPVAQAIPTQTPTPAATPTPTPIQVARQQPVVEQKPSIALPKPSFTPTPSPILPSSGGQGLEATPPPAGGPAAQKAEQKVIVDDIEDTHKKIEATIEELQHIAKEAKDIQKQHKDDGDKREDRPNKKEQKDSNRGKREK